MKRQSTSTSAAKANRNAEIVNRLEAEIERLRAAHIRIVDLLGAAKNDGKNAAVKESNANRAWHEAARALSSGQERS